MATGWASEYPCLEREVIRREVAHVSDPDKLEVASVRPKNVIAYLSEYVSLPDLGPSLQVPKPAALAEVSDQVYETVLHDKVRQSLVLQAPCLVEVHIQPPKENGVPEALQQ